MWPVLGNSEVNPKREHNFKVRFQPPAHVGTEAADRAQRERIDFVRRIDTRFLAELRGSAAVQAAVERHARRRRNTTR